MTMKIFYLITYLFIYPLWITTNSYAAGGLGATCNPATANWSNCSLAPVPFQASITKTINIPGGNYATPYIANSDNTEYILQGNINANGTAIVVTGNYVIINLNRHTINYNQTAVGEGVVTGAWNKHHISIRNGTIIQGAALSEGDVYGRGNNPVTTYNSANSSQYSAKNLHVANLYVRFGGRDMGGIVCSGSEGLYEQNTIEDTYQFGTLKNRHQGNDALTGTKGSNSPGIIYRNNTIINARHRGINTAIGSEVYGNKISIRSIATNSYGILGYAKTNVKVYNNTITGRGEHPIGIGFVSAGTDNIEIYNNDINVKTTAIGDEYAGSPACFNPATPCGNYAVGFRTTWGGNHINFHHNKIYIDTDTSYDGTYSVTGASIKVNAKGRGLMVAINSEETATFANNTITVLDKDGSGHAFGMVCTGGNASDQLFFLENIVTSNITNMVLSDKYGPCDSYPLIKGNTFIKANNYPIYKTISNQLSGYSTTTGRIIDNQYQNGASIDSINFNPSGKGTVNVYYGSIINNEYRYSHRFHDNSGNSSTLLREDFTPAKTLDYSTPQTTSTSTSTPSLASPQGFHSNVK